ncbi:MAG TPA: hypothetical protein VJ755_05915 [Gemmatimonadales bacterium]|nr:hypothetical protein [Gemmatimonadales bacterium]
MKPTLVRSVSLVVVALLVAASLAAQGTQANLYDRLQVGASMTTIILNANIRVDGSNGVGTDIDAEDDLGLAKGKIEARLAVRWRPWRRHEFEGGYQFARRSGTQTLQRDITFGDSTYPAGIDVGSTLNSDQAFFVYRFAFMTKPRSQVGLAIGAGALLLDESLDAFGTGGQVQYSQSQEITGPIGSVGLYGRFLSGTRWSWEAEARYLRVAIDRFDGRVWEGGAAIRYAAWPNVTFEGGYGLTAVNVEIAQASSGGGPGSRSGRIKYSLQNVRLGVVLIP